MSVNVIKKMRFVMKKIKKCTYVILVLGTIVFQAGDIFVPRDVFAASAVGTAVGDCLFSCLCSFFKKCSEKKKNKHEELSEISSEDEENSDKTECRVDEIEELKKSEMLAARRAKSKQGESIGKIKKSKSKQSKMQNEKEKEEDTGDGVEYRKSKKNVKTSEKIKGNENRRKIKKKDDEKKDRKQPLEQSGDKNAELESDDNAVLEDDAGEDNYTVITPKILKNKLAKRVVNPDDLYSMENIDLSCLFDGQEEQRNISIYGNANSNLIPGLIVGQNVSEPVLILQQPDYEHENLELSTDQIHYMGVFENQNPSVQIVNPILRTASPTSRVSTPVLRIRTPTSSPAMRATTPVLRIRTPTSSPTLIISRPTSRSTTPALGTRTPTASPPSRSTTPAPRIRTSASSPTMGFATPEAQFVPVMILNENVNVNLTQNNEQIISMTPMNSGMFLEKSRQQPLTFETSYRTPKGNMFMDSAINVVDIDKSSKAGIVKQKLNIKKNMLTKISNMRRASHSCPPIRSLLNKSSNSLTTLDSENYARNNEFSAGVEECLGMQRRISLSTPASPVDNTPSVFSELYNRANLLGKSYGYRTSSPTTPGHYKPSELNSTSSSIHSAPTIFPSQYPGTYLVGKSYVSSVLSPMIIKNTNSDSNDSESHSTIDYQPTSILKKPIAHKSNQVYFQLANNEYQTFPGQDSSKIVDTNPAMSETYNARTFGNNFEEGEIPTLFHSSSTPYFATQMVPQIIDDINFVPSSAPPSPQPKQNSSDFTPIGIITPNGLDMYTYQK
jgi:hypothetical protein